jgi:hypothetical protein
MYLIDTVIIMKEKIKPLIEDFRKIESMPQVSEKHRALRQEHVESWFDDRLADLEIKLEPGVSLTISPNNLGVYGVRHFYFNYIDIFDNICITIKAQFGGKGCMHEIISLIHFPD